MKFLAAAFVLVICFASITAAQSARPKSVPTDDKSIIAQLENDNNKARITGDGTMLEKLYADDFAGVNAMGGATTKKQIVDFYSGGKENAAKISESDQSSIRIYDKTAIVSARYKYQSFDDLDWLRYTRVYAFKDNRWQIVAEHFCFIKNDE